MIFITGPLYSGKRTFAQTLPGKASVRRAGSWLQMPPTCLPWQTSLPMNTISSSPPR